MANDADRDKPSRDVLIREIDSTLTLVEADSYTRALAVLKIIDRGAPDDQAALLQHVARSWDEAETSGEHKAKPAIGDAEKRELELNYGKVVDSLFDLAVKANPPEREFYESLLELIQNPIFITGEARAFAIYWILIDRRMPYFQMTPGLRLSDEDFKALARKLQSERAELRFITEARSEQRSEEADRVLKVLDRKGGTERVRLMATLIWELREQGTRAATKALMPHLPPEIRDQLT